MLVIVLTFIFDNAATQGTSLSRPTAVPHLMTTLTQMHAISVACFAVPATCAMRGSCKIINPAIRHKASFLLGPLPSSR